MGFLKAHFILYVSDQARSAAFYKAVFGADPVLDVPGMTEFELLGGAVLGLMPESGIKRLLGDALPDPSRGAGIPRAELYLVVSDASGHLQRAIDQGAAPLSGMAQRNWGDVVGYCLDPDGHVLAFADASRGA